MHAVVAWSTFSSQNLKKSRSRTTFGSRDVEKVHAVVARSTFSSRLGPLLEVEMSKKWTPLWREAIFQVQTRKDIIFGPLWEGEMSKKWTRLWCEAHFQVKSVKESPSRTAYGRWDVEKVDRVVVRSTFSSHGLGPLMEVAMLKKCTPLCGETHFQVKMYKARPVRTTFDGVVLRGRRRDSERCQKEQNVRVL